MKRLREDESEHTRLEQDFAGEFGEIRRSTRAVDASKLISDSKPVNPLKLIKLTNFDNTSDEEEEKEVDSADSDFVNLVHTDEIKEKSAKSTPKKVKLQRKRNDEENNPNPVHDDSGQSNTFTTSRTNISPPVKLPKLVRLQDSQDEEKSPDDSSILEPEVHTTHDEIERQNEAEVFDATTQDSLETKTTNLKAKLYKKLTGRSTERPYELDDKFNEIYNLISSTVLKGEKNSSFIYGPRNSGKTAVFESALEKLRLEVGDSKDFILIRINGLVQEDDKLAVRAIGEQLDSEISRIYNIDLDELEVSELFSRKSINTTFSNILKILDDELNSGSANTAKIQTPIIFVIDEVEQFANQGRQTLLYNLFDLVETSKTPISVLCFTTKATVKETLEKRVRSRFSQRTIQFNGVSMEKFLVIGQKLLSIDKPQNVYEKHWNSKVEDLIGDKSSQLRRLLTLNHLTHGSIKDFQNHCIFPISQINATAPFIQDSSFARYAVNLKKSSLKAVINSLSDLELYLLVSCARVILKKDLSWVNLNLCYEEYEAQIKAKNNEISSRTGVEAVTKTDLKVWSKESCRKPWELLQSVGLLTRVSSHGDFNSNSFETKLWQLEVTLDELRLVVSSERPVKSWTRL